LSDKKSLVKALSHELRFEILAILNERTASPPELARELGEDLDEVHYHVGVLLQCECIELAGARVVSGSVERFYRAIKRAMLSAEQMEEIPLEQRELLTQAWLSDVFATVSSAQKRGTIDARTDRHLSATPLALDERGWGELTQATADFLGSVLEIEKRSQRRLEDEGEDGVPAMVTIMSFQMPERHRKLGPRRRGERPLP
jgi:DNA-binding transcriptional ArsR family regulator